MKRVMIVDDSLYTRMILRDLLLTHGYSIVAEGASGRKTLEMFSKSMPDLLIINASMPDMDGIAATREVRREYPDALVLLTASNGQRAAVVEGFSAGASDFLVKPYSPKRVIQTIRKYIG